jgi:branched-chain amino acid transport system permease protein
VRVNLRPVDYPGRLGALWPAVSCAGILCLLALAAYATGDLVTIRVITNMLITVILVVGLYVFVGNSGIISFGQITFMAIGAYATSTLTVPVALKVLQLPDMPPFITHLVLPTVAAIAIGAAFAAIAGLLVAVPIMRLSGISASIATLAVLVVAQVVALNWVSLTRGASVLIGIPTDATLVPCLGAAILAVCLALGYQMSRHGRALRASKQDEFGAAAIGINVKRERRIAFVLSAAIIGMGGGVWSHFIGPFSAESFYLDATFITVAMLVIGGIDSLTGAVVGTIVVSAIQEFFRRLENGADVGTATISLPAGVTPMLIALAMLILLLARPKGIMGGEEMPWPGWIFSWRPRHGAGDESPPIASDGMVAAEPDPDLESAEAVAKPVSKRGYPP